MSDITIDDVRSYVKEKGPKKIRNVSHVPFGVIDYLSIKIAGMIVRVPKEKRSGWYRHDISARIQEILPTEGHVFLSGRNGKVIIYDEDSRSYREAAFDISEGQPIPTKKSFELNGHRPLGSLETVYFSRGSGEAANFLENALELFSAPVVEIGRHVGDSCNRYFAMRKYSG